MLNADTEVTNFQIFQRERERRRRESGLQYVYINIYGDIYIIFISLHLLFGLGRLLVLIRISSLLFSNCLALHKLSGSFGFLIYFTEREIRLQPNLCRVGFQIECRKNNDLTDFTKPNYVILSLT